MKSLLFLLLALCCCISVEATRDLEKRAVDDDDNAFTKCTNACIADPANEAITGACVRGCHGKRSVEANLAVEADDDYEAHCKGRCIDEPGKTEGVCAHECWVSGMVYDKCDKKCMAEPGAKLTGCAYECNRFILRYERCIAEKRCIDQPGATVGVCAHECYKSGLRSVGKKREVEVDEHYERCKQKCMENPHVSAGDCEFWCNSPFGWSVEKREVVADNGFAECKQECLQSPEWTGEGCDDYCNDYVMHSGEKREVDEDNGIAKCKRTCLGNPAMSAGACDIACMGKRSVEKRGVEADRQSVEKREVETKRGIDEEYYTPCKKRCMAEMGMCEKDCVRKCWSALYKTKRTDKQRHDDYKKCKEGCGAETGDCVKACWANLYRDKRSAEEQPKTYQLRVEKNRVIRKCKDACVAEGKEPESCQIDCKRSIEESGLYPTIFKRK